MNTKFPSRGTPPRRVLSKSHGDDEKPSRSLNPGSTEFTVGSCLFIIHTKAFYKWRALSRPGKSSTQRQTDSRLWQRFEAHVFLPTVCYDCNVSVKCVKTHVCFDGPRLSRATAAIFVAKKVCAKCVSTSILRGVN